MKLPSTSTSAPVGVEEIEMVPCASCGFAAEASD